MAMWNVECGVWNKKIKAIISFVLILLVCLAGMIFAEEDIESFVTKAETTHVLLEQSNEKFQELKEKYRKLSGVINTVKENRENSFISKIITDIQLKYYLGKGNKLSYKLHVVSQQLKIFEEEEFTYASIVLEDYNKKIIDCLDSGCVELKIIYSERKKWSKIVSESNEVLKLDISLDDFFQGYREDALVDLKDYIDEKIIQISQRIYILSEEKDIYKRVKNAGLKIKSSDIAEIDAKINMLTELSKSLSKELHKINLKLGKSKTR